MKVTGIIAEYNPFHKGHEYQIKKARELTDADYVIVVMSGDFTQRGAPALLDKYTRARMALDVYKRQSLASPHMISFITVLAVSYPISSPFASVAIASLIISVFLSVILYMTGFLRPDGLKRPAADF